MEFVSQLILNLLQQNFNYSFSSWLPRSPAKRSLRGPGAFCSQSGTLFLWKMEPSYSRCLSEQMWSQAVGRPQEESTTAPCPAQSATARVAGGSVRRANRTRGTAETAQTSTGREANVYSISASPLPATGNVIKNLQ